MGLGCVFVDEVIWTATTMQTDCFHVLVSLLSSRLFCVENPVCSRAVGRAITPRAMVCARAFSMTKSWIDPYNRTAVTQNWPAGVPLRDIFSPALPLFP